MILDPTITDKRIKRSFETIEHRFNVVHNCKYTYKNAIFKGVDHKLTVTCPMHGDWDIAPKNHLVGNGCLKCHVDSLPKSTEKFIEDARKTHGDKFDYSEVVYKTTHDKVKLTCNTCGYCFQQNAKSHITGTGCPSCAQNQRYSTEEYVAKADKVHNGKYSYTNTIYINSETKIIIACPIHGDFEQTAGAHLAGQGCGTCNPGGFNKNLPGRLYYLKVDIANVPHYKIGITNGTVRTRFKRSADRNRITIIKQKVYENGADALAWETFFKSQYAKYQYRGTKVFLDYGDTELFTVDILELFNKEKANAEINPEILPDSSS